MTSAPAADLLASIKVPVVCESCSHSLYLQLLRNGTRAYGSTCGCRLSPLAAAPLESQIVAVFEQRAGACLSEIPVFLLHEFARRLFQVRVGSVAEEVTCVWH